MNETDITRKYYDEHAEELALKYRRKFLLPTSGEREMFMYELPSPSEKVHLLNVGSGDGSYALFFREQGYEVVCLDNSREMLFHCEESGFRTYLMDLHDLRLPSNYFSGVWARASLVHTPQDKVPGIISRLSDTLVDEGIIYVGMKEGEGHEWHDGRPFYYWSHEGLVDVMNEHFEEVNSWVWTDQDNPNKLQYIQYVGKKL